MHHVVPSLLTGYFACVLYLNLLPASLLDFRCNIFEKFKCNCLIICCSSYQFIILCRFSNCDDVLKERLLYWFTIRWPQREYCWFVIPTVRQLQKWFYLVDDDCSNRCSNHVETYLAYLGRTSEMLRVKFYFFRKIVRRTSGRLLCWTLYLKLNEFFWSWAPYLYNLD